MMKLRRSKRKDSFRTFLTKSKQKGGSISNHRGELTEAQKKELKNAFDMFDINGDGTLEVHELQRAMRKLGQNPSMKELTQLVNSVDKDGDGELNFEEFVKMMKSRISDDSHSPEEKLRDAFKVLGTTDSKELKKLLNGQPVPSSISIKVARCWELLSAEDRLEEVGEKTFMRMFQERPDLLELFGYGGLFDDVLGKDRELPKGLKLHSHIVIRTIGECVSVKNKMETMVPFLRSIGDKHTVAGVEDSHYELLFRCLMEILADELGDDWNTETQDAWDLVYHSVSSIIKRPNQLVQLEPVQGWGLIQTVVCSYIFFYTPFRMGAFVGKYGVAERTFTICTSIAVTCLLIDLLSNRISQWLRHSQPKKKFQNSDKDKPKKNILVSFYKRLTRPVRYRTRKFFLGLKMEQWASWPVMDLVILISFPLQYMHRRLYPDQYIVEDVTLPPAGVHWTYLVGLVRLVAIRRVFHSFNCAENNLMLVRRFTQQDLLLFQLLKLVVLVAVFVHLAACLWCLIARIELGPGGFPGTSTPFFPNPELLMGRAGTLNSYLHAVHWSWVNLSGIGDVDSSPVSSLECLVILFTHICGATLYTIATGNVVAMLDKMTQARNRNGEDLAELGEFMTKCDVALDDQQIILQGYMMNQLVSDPSAKDSNDSFPILPEAAERLPEYLKNQLAYYSRARAMRHRDPAFLHLSKEFLFALIGSLQNTSMLLTGDFLFKAGDTLPHEFIFVAEGTLEVIENEKCVRLLQRGDVIGKRWLLMASGEDDKTSYISSKSIRAMSPCKLLSGLSNREHVLDLHDRFYRDFIVMKEDRKRVNYARSKSTTFFRAQ